MKVLEDSLHAGRAAIQQYAWAEAFDLLSGSDQKEPLAVGDLELLGEAAFWAGHYDEGVRAWERAYAAHSAADNKRRAANAAMELASLHAFRQAQAVAAGWFYNAIELLADEPEAPEHAWLAWIQAWSAVYLVRDLKAGLTYADQAVEIGHRLHDRDTEALGLSIKGSILLYSGELEEGMKLLDAAMGSAVGGELGPKATGYTYCATISSCQYVGDYRRAGEWSDQVQRCAARPGMNDFPGDCRVHRASVLRLRGEWAQAEAEAVRACIELKDMNYPHAGDAFYEIGEVRLRMGDLTGAEDAFRQCREFGREAGIEPQPGLSLLRLFQGKPDEAVAAIKTTLTEGMPDLIRAQVLPGAVEVMLATGLPGDAHGYAEELSRIAVRFGTPALQAHAATATGAVALARGDANAALRSLRSALRLWQDIGAPYEAARVRVALGSALRGLGNESDAAQELGSALAAFTKLGAEKDRQAAAAALGRTAELGSTGDRVVRTFMFTDIVGSTELISAMGDDAWCDLLSWHDETLRSVVAEHRGEEVKQVGDGFFVAFESPKDALDCAAAIQRRLAEHRRDHGFAPRVRIGVHGADAVRTQRDYSGRAVNQAARIGALAEGDEVLVSEATLTAAGSAFGRSKASLETLKGLPEPVPVAALEWR